MSPGHRELPCDTVVPEQHRRGPLHGRTLVVTDGAKLNEIKLYPIDLSLWEADPQQLLDQAQKEAGLKLEGFSLVPLK